MGFIGHRHKQFTSQSGEFTCSQTCASSNLLPFLSDSDSETKSSTSDSQSISSNDVLNFSLVSEEPEQSAQSSAPADILFTADPTTQNEPPKLYKLVFDNLNKNLTPRYMQSDVQTSSLNYVQIYSVKSRIDFSSFAPTHEITTEIPLFDILPSATDYQVLKGNFAILVARIIHDHIPFFSDDFKGLIPEHTPHQYSDNMATESEVVST
jgi:hypothetical protein